MALDDTGVTQLRIVLVPIGGLSGGVGPEAPIDLACALPAFLPPEAIQVALAWMVAERGIAHPTAEEKAAFDAALAHWQRDRHGWSLGDAQIVRFAGATQALAALTSAVTPPGGVVVAEAPTYPGIQQVVASLGRRLETVPAGATAGGVEACLRRTASRLVVLCNPHNPMGLVSSRDRLAAMAVMAKERGALVVADEVHADFVGSTHVPLASLAGEAPVASIVSPGKTFAMAGLGVAALVGPPSVVGPAAEVPQRLLGYPSAAAILGATAGWRYGPSWLSELRAVVGESRRRLRAALAGTAACDVAEPHGFLAWIDATSCPDPGNVVQRCLRQGVVVADGSRFGRLGEGHVRVCLARPPGEFDVGVERLIRGLTSAQ